MKGQYFSFDAIIASVIFVLALVALLSYWHSVRSFLDFQNDQVSQDTIKVSNSLFYPPAPSTDCSSLITMGFGVSWDDRRVNESFMLNCASLKTEQQLQQEFGTPYGIAINVTNLANGTMTNLPPGESIPTNATDIVKIRRLATVVNSTGGTHLATIDLTLYK